MGVHSACPDYIVPPWPVDWNWAIKSEGKYAMRKLGLSGEARLLRRQRTRREAHHVRKFAAIKDKLAYVHKKMNRTQRIVKMHQTIKTEESGVDSGVALAQLARRVSMWIRVSFDTDVLDETCLLLQTILLQALPRDLLLRSALMKLTRRLAKTVGLTSVSLARSAIANYLEYHKFTTI